ncbi:MAG: protease HtpX [Deltaproteobacteria bacterium]|nr:protease HtpX [Deltaproteobacteria bacterium]
MWLKRIGLFLTVNALVVLTISLLLNLFGVQPHITAYGLNYGSLIVFCLLWGMGGAFISLAMSRVMAKWMMGVKIIPPDTTDFQARELLETVHDLARAANLPVMPQVGVYESAEVNAFATGPTKSRSLVAVSSGLLQRMKVDEVRGVLGHEVAHIANGDMVTMTLIQGVVNAFVMFLARVIAFALTMSGRKDDEEASQGTPFAYYAVQMVLEIVFMILGSMVVAWFSRYREFRADQGGAQLAGRENMILALESLKRTFEDVDPAAQPAVQALKISSRPGGIMKLFSTHPPLEERIKRLRVFA